MYHLTAERWEQVQHVFHGALDVPAVGRPAYLLRSCKHDVELLEEVKSLLSAEAELPTYLKSPSLFLYPSLEPGHIIGPYQVLKSLGHGGMGHVYLAEHVRDGNHAALKVVHHRSARIIKQFNTEQCMLRRLTHPNIARLYHSGKIEHSPLKGMPYFAMEYIDGQPITQYCISQNVPLKERLWLFTQVCDAVQYAHHNRIVHRDIKPANVLACTNGKQERHVKLLDFGIAKSIDIDAQSLYQTEGSYMTPAYAAPEQLVNASVTTATDIYALGLLLYELITGKRAKKLMKRTFSARVQILLEVYENKGMTQQIASDLDCVCMNALHKAPENRYPSAISFRDEVRGLLTLLSLSAQPQPVIN